MARVNCCKFSFLSFSSSMQGPSDGVEYKNVTVTGSPAQSKVSTHSLQNKCICTLASFPGSPLPTTKNRKGEGEPGIDSHVILRHDDVTAIIAYAVTFHLAS